VAYVLKISNENMQLKVTLRHVLVHCRSVMSYLPTACVTCDYDVVVVVTQFQGVFDYANLKPVSDLGFSVQTECTKPLTNRYQGDKIH